MYNRLYVNKKFFLNDAQKFHTTTRRMVFGMCAVLHIILEIE